MMLVGTAPAVLQRYDQWLQLLGSIEQCTMHAAVSTPGIGQGKIYLALHFNANDKWADCWQPKYLEMCFYILV